MRAFSLLLVFLAGCDSKRPDNVESSGPYCDDAETAVALDEVTPLGFAAADILALAEASRLIPFDWADGGETELALGVEHVGGEARYIDSEAVYPEGEEAPAIGVICDDRVEVDVAVAFSTADGAFDEDWIAALGGSDASTASFTLSPDPTDLDGTYDVAEDAPEVAYEEAIMYLDAWFSAEGAGGAVMGQVSGEDCEYEDTEEYEEGGGEDCTSWAESFEIAVWGVPSE